MVPVRIAGEADREAVSAMLARAFLTDPAYAFILPDVAERGARLTRLFGLLFDSDGRAGFRLLADDGGAATLWRGPGRARIGWGEMLRHAGPLLQALGVNIGRALQVSAAIDAHMPARPFWYLHCAGCEPERQRLGLGTAAVSAGVERTTGLPIYLETATETNVLFYERLGFVVTAEWRVGAGGLLFWSMMRQPTSG